ncbi:ABC transporter ATP-binding protein [Celeribacter naphthalenivorans]|uniref:ABC transporter ATP-binding protein n=1 Tax=Celeribacter naphthalenivorans TaxID=1614694 RepID=UPI001CF9DD37|nr:ABC transporter ATP-binding protein [Celeribacter naphthalenivorans]
MTVEPILDCRGVTKRYDALVAVDNVDFTVNPGEVVGIGGPNGAGKTTFFDLVSGLTVPSNGDVFYQGKPLGRGAPHKIASMGLARTFQLNAAFDSMTVFENMLVAQTFGGHSDGGWLLASRRDKERAYDTLERFGLLDVAEDEVASVPVLVRKKLMVATALAQEPKVLLLDEPVGGLTPSEIDEFLELMLGIKGQITIVFIEHVMRFLTALADRAIIMHQGRFIYDGAPKELGSDPVVRSVYLGNSEVA